MKSKHCNPLQHMLNCLAGLLWCQELIRSGRGQGANIRVAQLTCSLGLLHADYVSLQTVQKSPQAPPRVLQRGTQAIHIPGYHLHAFVVAGPSRLDYGRVY